MTHAKPQSIDVIRINVSHALSLEDDARESYDILSKLTTEYLEKDSEFTYVYVNYKCLIHKNLALFITKPTLLRLSKDLLNRQMHHLQQVII